MLMNLALILTFKMANDFWKESNIVNYCISTLNWDSLVAKLSFGCFAGRGMLSLIAVLLLWYI